MVQRALLLDLELTGEENPILCWAISFFKEVGGALWGQLKKFMTLITTYRIYKPVFAR